MAKQAKKTPNKLFIIACSVSAFLILVSWSWLLLFIPPISNNAEGFLHRYFTPLFTAFQGNDKDARDSQDSGNTADTTASPETKPEETRETENTASGTTSNVPSKPTIRLRIYEGPLYSASDDSCYYKIRAIVTGNPAPSVEFSKDDSEGLLGAGMAQVNLKRNMKSYTLTATASNSQGTVMDSITLNWGCNSNPVISDVNLSTDIVYVNKQYELTVKASDSDGDKLSYKWTVSGGTLSADNLETVKWNTPSKSDDYVVKVVVEDGQGGSTSKSLPVYVGNMEVTETTQPPDTTPATTAPPTTSTSPQETSLNLARKTGEGGYLEYGGGTYPGENVIAGDSASNKSYMGFISFDIISLAGETINSATLTFSGAIKYGSPLSGLFDAFWINVVEWGAEPIVQSDYKLPGVAIQSFNTSSITCTADKLKTELQKAINSGKSRFQIRVHFSGPATDNDDTKDAWEYAQTSINLNVKYY